LFEAQAAQEVAGALLRAQCRVTERCGFRDHMVGQLTLATARALTSRLRRNSRMKCRSAPLVRKTNDRSSSGSAQATWPAAPPWPNVLGEVAPKPMRIRAP